MRREETDVGEGGALSRGVAYLPHRAEGALGGEERGELRRGGKRNPVHGGMGRIDEIHQRVGLGSFEIQNQNDRKMSYSNEP